MSAKPTRLLTTRLTKAMPTSLRLTVCACVAEPPGSLLNCGSRCCATARTLRAGPSRAGIERRLLIGGMKFGRGTSVVKASNSFSTLRWGCAVTDGWHTFLFEECREKKEGR